MSTLPSRNTYVRYTADEIGQPQLIGRVAGYAIIDPDPLIDGPDALVDTLVAVDLRPPHRIDAFDDRLHVRHVLVHPHQLEPIDAGTYVATVGQPRVTLPGDRTMWVAGPGIGPNDGGVQPGDVLRVTGAHVDDDGFYTVFCEYEDGSGEINLDVRFFAEHMRRHEP